MREKDRLKLKQKYCNTKLRGIREKRKKKTQITIRLKITITEIDMRT